MEGDLSARIPVRGHQRRDRPARARPQRHARPHPAAARRAAPGQQRPSPTTCVPPLGRLRQRLEDAREHATTTAEYQAATEGALGEADSLLEIFSALLRIAQIEAGAQKSAFTAVDLSALMRSIAEAYGPSAEDSQHKLEADIADGVILTGDRQLLAQFFSNLVENALAHTPGRQHGTAGVADHAGRLRSRGRGTTARAIPAPERDKVFDRFYRLDRSRTMKGSGPRPRTGQGGSRPCMASRSSSKTAIRDLR